VVELAGKWPLKKIGCDRKFGEGLLPLLEQGGLEVARVAQSFANLCVPWQQLERLIGNGLLAHGGHRVLRWNAGNVVLVRDPDNLVIPSKAKSAEKIDGIAALQNAVYLSLITPFNATNRPLIHHTLPKSRGGGKRDIYSAFKR
jgi:phage terminase large subunit-like protein